MFHLFSSVSRLQDLVRICGKAEQILLGFSAPLITLHGSSEEPCMTLPPCGLLRQQMVIFLSQIKHGLEETIFINIQMITNKNKKNYKISKSSLRFLLVTSTWSRK